MKKIRFVSGLQDWENSADGEILSQVLALSQQEYLENLKKTSGKGPSTSMCNNEEESDEKPME